ncbi:unnamed protein product [Cylicostephanus goldi]|uniref:Uncharacterized protein n=1 Tax=Cylicostephanus goldi TaxID=71465 RepID=A0A3P7NCD1_CYLGO|nr:unnamed protein product [Cylicostephanus goldi]
MNLFKLPIYNSRAKLEDKLRFESSEIDQESSHLPDMPSMLELDLSYPKHEWMSNSEDLFCGL